MKTTRNIAALSVVVALGLAGPVMAPATAQGPAPQAPPPGTSSTPGNMGAGNNGNPAVKSPRANSDQKTSAAGTAALEAGANSFTESQARSRIEGAGFGKVTGLAKDQQGIWRGKAQKDGRMVSVGLDFKGNVASQ